MRDNNQNLNGENKMTNSNFKSMSEKELQETISCVETMASTELLNMYNNNSEKPAKKFRDRKTAVKRVTILIEEKIALLVESRGSSSSPKKKNLAMEKTVKAIMEKGSETKSDKKVKPLKTFDKTKIVLIGTDNPKREGSKSWDRFELYTVHNTVESYLNNGGKRADLAWDQSHGFITYQ